MAKRTLKYWIKNFIIVHVAAFVIIVPLFHSLLTRPLSVKGAGEVIDVPQGTTVKMLAERLRERGIVHYPRVMEWYTRLTMQDKQLQAGEYMISPHTSIMELISKIRNGSVIVHEIRFVEGLTARQFIQSIRDNPYIKQTINFNDPNWFRQFSGQYDNPEGLLMPDTYLFTKGETDAAIIKRAYSIMQMTLNVAWANRKPNLPYVDSYSALIAASIIEKETAIPSERNMVAGVIVRRLEQHMKLQMDPTVIYALGDLYKGDITKAQLAYKSPYNTYVVNGLPPTPICMPSKASIMAAVSPDSGTSLYFVATGNNGTHQFSDTLESHNKAVVEYVLPPTHKESAWPAKTITGTLSH